MKLRNRKFGRGISLLLAAVMMLTSACGTKNGENTEGPGGGDKVSEELAPEYVYVSDYLSLDSEQSYYNAKFVGDEFYNLSGTFDGYSYRQTLVKTAIQDGKLGETQEVLAFEDSVSPNQFIVTDKGEIYLVVSVRRQSFNMAPEDLETTDTENGEAEGADPGEDGAEDSKPAEDSYDLGDRETAYFLVKYGSDAEKVFKTDLKDLAEGQDWFYVRAMTVDDQGRTYLCLEQEIALYDENGAFKGKIELGTGINWVDSIGVGKDGKTYICYYKSGEGGGGYALSEVDFENKKLGAAYENFISGNGGGIQRGVNKDFLVYDQNALYEYSLADQKAEKVFTWLDCDIDSSNVNAVSMDQDGKVFVMLRDWSSNTNELAMMHKVKSDEVTQRETIVLGMLSSDSRISARVVEFNKTNDKYRISVKTYMDSNSWSETTYQDAITSLTNDLTSGNGPDILDVSSLRVDLANYVRKGIIEDLNPYLNNSTVISREDFFENILKGASYDGTLAYIPSTFSLTTLAAKSSEVGKEPGWTLADMIAYSQAHPKTVLMEYTDKATILQMMLMLNQDQYMDMTTGKCQFDSQEFKEVLTFANSFPDDLDNRDKRLTPNKIADGSLLLADASIYDFQSIQSTLAYFGDEDVTFIGYPTNGEGNGCLLLVNDGYVINAKSKHKEGAWTFLEAMLARDITEDWFSFGFPTRKSLYEKQKEKATKVEYILDENGDPYLDENGEPIIAGAGGGWTMHGEDGDSWSFESHPVTQEEAATVEELLSDAVFFSYNFDEELMEIISSEAKVYFQGDKSVDEVAGVIQNRVSLYLKENMD